MNTLQQLLGRFPDKPWDWGAHGLSQNPNVTMADVERHPDQPWEWGAYGLSKNPNVTMADVERHPDKPWSWGAGGLSQNPNVTMAGTGENRVLVRINSDGHLVIFLS